MEGPSNKCLTFISFNEDFVANEERLNIERAAKNISIPHLILHGALDRSIALEQGEKLHSWTPKSCFKIIPNADHVFNVSHPWTRECFFSRVGTNPKMLY